MSKYSDKILKILEEGKRCKSMLGPGVGPTGPQGPAGVAATNVYGSKYDTVGDNIVLTADTLTQVPLNNVGLSSGIDSALSNALTINQDGVYKIDYYFQGSTNMDATVTFEVIRNDNSISSTTFSKDFKTNEDNGFNGSSIVNLTAGDIVSLGLEASENLQISPATSVNAYLNIIKIA